MFIYYSFVRHRAALALLFLGTLLLIGAQHLFGNAANAQTAAVADTHDLLPLATATLAPAPPVAAAISTGTFEEPYHQPTPAPTVVPTPAPTVAPSPTPQASVFESGIASTYGELDGFEGNRTACGQVFHTNVVQVAHKSLPCGTQVRVVDTSSGRSVDAPVTDRGPYVAGRIVDLSWGAFQQLHPSGVALLHVDVYVLGQVGA